MEQVVETRQCKYCGISFDITDKDIEMLNKISPIIGDKKIELPLPTLCPDCRQQRRLAWRNERCLYHGKCDLSGKKIISLYSPEKKITVYHYPERRSDKRDEMKYARDFDFNQTFFEQFKKLLHEVPRISTYNKRTENTEYGNNVIEDKDCYLLFVTFGNENCYYGHTMGYCKNCVDNLRIISCQNCYDCTKTQNCYECFHCFNCHNCFSSQYLVDCINVDSSAFCIGLRGQKNYFLNKSYSKSEYKEILQKLQHDNIFLKESEQAFAQLKLSTPVNANVIENSENSSGDYLDNCKNSIHCFDTMLTEDCRYCYDTANAADHMDVYLGGASFLNTTGTIVYESENSFNSSSMYFCSSVAFHSNNIIYSDTCHSCKNCFGCVGMRHKEYCILNKQYTKEEYEILVPKIIEHMKHTGERGEFFPISMSLFGYNETQAQAYYPLTKEQAETKGWKRFDKEKIKVFEGDNILYTKDLLDIKDVKDDIVNKVIICEISGKPFKIIKQELDFYRKYNLPLPTKHPDQRHAERMKLKPPRKIFHRNCVKCSAKIETGYDSERKEIVYCQKCYYKEIYG